MKRFFFFALLLSGITCAAFSQTADTTTVRVHNRTHMNYYNAFDAKGLFPPATESFRKIWLYFTIGCPDKGCSEWDYTTKVFIRKPTGVLDTAGKEIKEDIEFARYITPYAGGYTKSFARTFRMDVTDYASLLHDSVEIRLFYEGYSDGFTVTTDFELIKGTPTRKAIEVANVYSGYFEYGNPNTSIEERLIARKFKLPAGAQSVRLRTLQTGHGGGTTQNCAEFCRKTAFVFINDEEKFQNEIWRDDCGLNPLFPQPGTWLYNRANWCPGAAITPFYNELTPFINLTDSFSVDVNMSEYTNFVGNQAGYNIATQLIYYAPATATNDAEIEDIIAPSNRFEYARMNPICGQPKILVRNNTAQKLTTLEITYGVQNGITKTTNWTGDIAPWQAQEIVLDPISLIGNEKRTFFAFIAKPNGIADDNTVNNMLTSAFDAVTQLPGILVVELRTNSKGTQSEYYVTDANGINVFEKKGLKGGTMYKDTLRLPDGCYKLRLIDKNKDGLSFFTFNSDGNGFMRLKNLDNSIIKTYEPNFGTEISEQFITADGVVAGVQQTTLAPVAYLFPNPAQSSVTVVLNSTKPTQVLLYNAIGKLLYQVQNNAADEVNMDIAHLPAGIYFVEVHTADGTTYKKLVKN